MNRTRIKEETESLFKKVKDHEENVKEIKDQNMSAALMLGLITWFDYLNYWRNRK